MLASIDAELVHESVLMLSNSFIGEDLKLLKIQGNAAGTYFFAGRRASDNCPSGSLSIEVSEAASGFLGTCFGLFSALRWVKTSSSLKNPKNNSTRSGIPKNQTSQAVLDAA